MNIAHVVDSMDVGGAETVVSQMCRLQRDQGHSPRIYAVAALGALGEQMRKEGFSVHTHLGSSLPDGTRNFFRIFKESQPEVVHLHNPTPTIYAAMPARLAGVSSIVSTRHSLVAQPRNLVVELKYGIAARFCDWIAGVCDATANNLKSIHSIPRRKIVRVYNGALPVARVDKEHQPPKSGFTLLFVGRLAPVKNHPMLLDAFCAALASDPSIRLWMVGDGSERKRLERIATEYGISAQVKFWGEQLDVAPFFSAADAFIMSSVSEGLPMSLLQALSLGLPAIVTDVGGMGEVVRLANAGFTVPLNDSAEMSAAILHLAHDDAEREWFSKNAEAAFQRSFTVQTMVDAYMDLYRDFPRARCARSAP
ncbi:MAG: glycosyltransferase [Acidobacteriaceae bacterium]